METFLYIVFFVSCIMLVIAVLLQPGKTDAGALFTSNISSSALNPRGTQSVLSKLTIVMATVFMLSALLLSLPAITGNVSVLETQGETTEQSNTAPQNTNSSETQEGAAPEEKPAEASEEKKEAETSESDSGDSAGSGESKEDE